MFYLIRFHCLFVVFRPTREFFNHMETLYLSAKGFEFELCSALIAIEQWWFFSVPPLWHEDSVYNGHLRGPETPKSNAELLAVELSLPVFTTKVYRGWVSDTQPSGNKHYNTLCHRCGKSDLKILSQQTW